MSGLLASVCSVAEAEIALQCRADIIDCKNPHQGALGALTQREIRHIVQRVAGTCPVSATTGDLSGSVQELHQAIRKTADCGVDYIKFGLFEAAQANALPHSLGRLPREHKLIAVCFADRFDPSPLLTQVADSGCRGVMIDTADKQTGPLTELWSLSRLAEFVKQARNLGLLCGLAGKLSLEDIPYLLPLGADYLGFRSALCGGNRRNGLEHVAMMQIRNTMPVHHNAPASHQTPLRRP